jgi:hypothetical protein
MIRYHISDGETSRCVDVERRGLFIAMGMHEHIERIEELSSVKKFISIERQQIIANRHMAVKRPVIVVEYEDGRPEEHWHQVEILGPSRVVYDPSNKELGDPMAHAWIETTAELECQ